MALSGRAWFCGALAAFACGAGLLAAWRGLQAAEQVETLVLDTERVRIRAVTIASGLDQPWGLAFLPDGDMLVTERPGRLRLIGVDGKISRPFEGLPEVVAAGQGGLLDVALDPEFAANHFVYLSYAEPRGGATSATAVARARLRKLRLEQLEVIFRQQPAVESGGHFGSRLAFGRDGRLFITLGERRARHFINHAQRLDTHFGKVVRIERDGRVPPDNPYIGRVDALPEIWSIGHRNPQGAALHPATGELWVTEHGPRGGDELNVARPGRNYGWPLITHGVAYSGERIGLGTSMPGLEQPVHHWTPSIGVSGLAFYVSERIPEWRGSVMVGGLASRSLVRLDLEGERVSHAEQLLTELGERVRDVRVGPDGHLYVLTDPLKERSPLQPPRGRLLRVEPAA